VLVLSGALVQVGWNLGVVRAAHALGHQDVGQISLPAGIGLAIFAHALFGRPTYQKSTEG
jgi:hypothetical protein